MSLRDLPTLNATLNFLSFIFLLIGYHCIRRKNVRCHRKMMLAAFTTSVLFLLSYLTYHFAVGVITPFRGAGFWRIVYLSVLISHSVLAAIVPFLAIVTLYRGLKMQVKRHRAIARWTLPVWLYVSITGALVYLMLYVWF